MEYVTPGEKINALSYLPPSFPRPHSQGLKRTTMDLPSWSTVSSAGVVQATHTYDCSLKSNCLKKVCHVQPSLCLPLTSPSLWPSHPAQLSIKPHPPVPLVWIRRHLYHSTSHIHFPSCKFTHTTSIVWIILTTLYTYLSMQLVLTSGLVYCASLIILWLPVCESLSSVNLCVTNKSSSHSDQWL